MATLRSRIGYANELSAQLPGPNSAVSDAVLDAFDLQPLLNPRGQFELDLPRPDYYDLDRGVKQSASSPARPCSPELIEALIEDLWMYATLLILEFPVSTGRISTEATLSDDMRLFMRYIRIIIKDCRRLKGSPELFPCPLIRKRFFAQVAVLTTTMAKLADIAKGRVSEKEAAFTFSSRQKLTGLIEDRDLASSQLPHFHPDKVQNNNPWGRWLENSALPAQGWVAIQQKIPRIGDKINRMKTLHFRALEAHFADHELVIRTDEEAKKNIGEPGDAYKHMTWSGFASIANFNLGFSAGGGKLVDEFGVLKLEELTGCVGCLYEDQNRGLSHSYPDNCPHFRFAVAYKL